MAEASPLKTAFARQHPDELAAYLATQSHDSLLHALHGLPADAGAAVLARLPHALAVRVLATQSDEVVAGWIGQAALDDALTVVLHLEPERRSAVLKTVPLRHMRRSLERLVVYPRKTVGALLDPTAVRLTDSTPLGQAIGLLRAGEQGSLEWIWLVDAEGRYVGMLDLSQALLARNDRQPVGELAIRLVPLRAETGLAQARDASEWLRHPELPVVDHLDHLLGTLSRQRLVDALEQEAPDDFGMLDGVASLTNQYFRVMGACLSGLLGSGRSP